MLFRSTSSISKVLTHFCTEVARTKGALTSPKKYGLNGTIPAFTNRRFGSSAIKDADGTTVCVSPWLFPLSKNFSHLDLISAEFNFYSCSSVAFFLRPRELAFLIFAAERIAPTACAATLLPKKPSVVSVIFVVKFSTFLLKIGRAHV